MAQRAFPFVLKGGIDLDTPTISKPPGTLIDCVNYEAANRAGYVSVGGYEIFDGRPAPSAAAYAIQEFNTGTTTPLVGDIIYGATSGASAKILAIEVDTGSWITNNAVGRFVVTKVAGTWLATETIQNLSATTTYATATSGILENGSTSDTLGITYTKLAREDYRADITGVTGSGSIRSVFVLNSIVYAIRDNVGGTASNIWKATPTGWVSVPLGGDLTFNTGITTEPRIGDVITGATSRATGVLTRVVLNSGTWTGGDALGRLFLHNVTGTFSNGESIAWAGGGATASTTGAYTVNTLPPGGRYETIAYNFGGQSETIAIYGANGVGKAFRFDGVSFSYLYTNPTIGAVDTNFPTHVFPHRGHLFLSVGSSIFHSSINAPFEYNIATGAAEIALGDTITGMVNVPGEYLAVFSRNSLRLVRGTSAADWRVDLYSRESGGIEWTCQDMSDSPKYLDDRGIKSIRTTAAYGDFKSATISQLVEPILQSKKSLVQMSLRCREKSQYRLFFSDKTGITMREMGYRKGYSFTRFEYPDQMVCAISAEDANGVERLYAGDTLGNVYELDIGDSFNGQPIDYAMRLSFTHVGQPNRRKRFFKVAIEVDAPTAPQLIFTPDFSYGDINIPSSLSYQDSSLQNVGGYWDGINTTWGNFHWDGAIAGEAIAYLDGSGTNISMLITGSSDYGPPHKIHEATIHYGIRGLKI